jgi:hypothetical protein
VQYRGQVGAGAGQGRATERDAYGAGGGDGATTPARMAIRALYVLSEQYSPTYVRARNVNHKCRDLNQCFVSARPTVPPLRTYTHVRTSLAGLETRYTIDREYRPNDSLRLCNQFLCKLASVSPNHSSHLLSSPLISASSSSSTFPHYYTGVRGQYFTIRASLFTLVTSPRIANASDNQHSST